jgi:L-fuconolactonase
MLELIDTHVHFWDTNFLRYDWLANEPRINHPFLPGDVPAQGLEWWLDGLVMVQAECAHDQAQQEVDWVAGLAAAHPVIKGMVAFAPLDQGEGARDHVAWLSRQPLVKGVRRLIQEEPVGFSTRPEFVRGVGLLADYGLSFDLCIRHHHLPEVIALVRQCPAVHFVLDHIGKPNIKDHVLEPWQSQISELASLPNVQCKLSGLVTEADRERWQPADLRPYINHVLSAFGPQRVMFGSDWPVQTLAARYAQWVMVLRDATATLPADDKRRLFSENARAFYRLPPAVAAA